MSEYIGSRISLISKSDIRWVGTLHEINSESSTVALENVKSFGTEGRKSDPGEEVAPSDSTYDYIVFRGSDVKDLRIEERSKETPQAPPQMPDDPAILVSGSKPVPQQQNYPPPRQNQPNQFQQQPPYQHQFNQYSNQQFRGPPGGPYPGFHGPPPGGFPNMPFGGPPGWGPPPNQYPPQYGPFSPAQGQQMPFGAPGMPRPGGPPQQPTPQQQSSSPAPPPGMTQAGQKPQGQTEAPAELSQEVIPNPKTIAKQQPPPPPVESKPDLATAAAPPVSTKPIAPSKTNNTAASSKVALPLANKPPGKPSPATPGIINVPTSLPSGSAASQATLEYQNATKAATAAVAAAMAKLPPASNAAGSNNPTKTGPITSNAAVDNLTQKVNEMRTDERRRNSSGRGHSSERGSGGHRGSRGGRGRGGGGTRGLEVPKTDFDFEKANAEFNKSDLVKEAIASGEPSALAATEANESHVDGSTTNCDYNPSSSSTATNGDVVIPPAPITSTYNKSSFFDNLSSELTDRMQQSNDGTSVEGAGTRGSRAAQSRREERSRNFETFGMGSVDGGFGGRGGYRGRGRGRGNSRGGSNYRGGNHPPGSRGRSRGGAAPGTGAPSHAWNNANEGSGVQA